MNEPNLPSTVLPTGDYKNIVAQRFAELPMPRTPTKANTIVLMPLHDGRMEFGTVTALMASAHLYTGVAGLPCCSDISYARNRLLNQFLRLPQFEWAILLDADIVFSLHDLECLLDGTDYAVNAPYMKKDETGTVVTQGLGFARIHRCLLEALIQLPELCLPFQRDGEQLFGFCFSGPTGVSQTYLGEDQALWLMIAQLGVHPRMEKRCRLKHVGRAEYHYDGEGESLEIPLRTA